MFLFDSCLFAQKKEIYLFTTDNSFCTQSIILFPDGFYNIEIGCESSSHFSFGNWIRVKDSIKFNQADIKKINVIKRCNTC